MAVPFAVDKQLYHKLALENGSLVKASKKKRNTLPGQPHIWLQDEARLEAHLETELRTTYLDDFAPYLWLVATQSHAHISSLTHQVVRGRQVVLTEDPRLHLTWYHDRVFVRALPAYLLSHAFWQWLQLDARRAPLAAAARGLVRSWSFLVRHRSDWALATSPQAPLLPANVSYGELMRFLAECERIEDADVSPRFRYGELRLSRINAWGQLLLRRLDYHRPSGQYSLYFTRYFGLVLFVFAFGSTALAALQVALQVVATQAVAPVAVFGARWTMLLAAAGGFAVAVLVAAAAIVLFLLLKFVAMGLREVVFATRQKWFAACWHS